VEGISTHPRLLAGEFEAWSSQDTRAFNPQRRHRPPESTSPSRWPSAVDAAIRLWHLRVAASSRSRSRGHAPSRAL